MPIDTSEDAEETILGLYDRFGDAIFSFFSNRGFSKEDSRDLKHDTFLEAWRSLHRFRGEAQVHSWLFSIAKNLVRRRQRDRSRLKRHGQEISLDEFAESAGALKSPTTRGGVSELGEDPLLRVLNQEFASQVRREIEAMPRQMRECLTLFYNLELRTKEIAILLKTSEGTIKTQLSKGRRRLRSALNEELTQSTRP